MSLRTRFSRVFHDALTSLQSLGSGQPASFPYLSPPASSSGDAASQYEGLFQSSISDTEREQLMARCGPAKAIIVDFVDDALDQGFQITTKLQGDPDEVRSNAFLAVFEPHRPQIAQALMFARLYGFAGLLFLSAEDTDFSAPLPKKPSPIQALQPIPKSWVDEVVVVQDASGRPLFPLRLLSYTMKSSVSIPSIHASRLEHILQPPSSNLNGTSALDAAFNGLTVWQHVLWGLGQSFWRSGNHLVTAIAPPEAEQWHLDSINDALSNISTKTAFALPYGSQVQTHGVDALSPIPYEEAALDEVASATRIPRKVLLGVQKGAVTGSETDVFLYLSTLSSFQSAVISPLLSHFFQRFQATGQLQSGDFFIQWNSPEMVSASQQAEIELTQARTEYVRMMTKRVHKAPLPVLPESPPESVPRPILSVIR